MSSIFKATMRIRDRIRTLTCFLKRALSTKKSKISKKPAAKEDSSEEEEDDEAAQEKKATEGKAKVQDMKDAYKEVAKKQRVLQQLERVRAKMSEKIKENQKEARKCQKEIDDLKNVASSKRRAAKKIEDPKVQRMLMGRMGRALAKRGSGKAKARAAEARLRKSKKLLKGAKEKAMPLKEALERAQGRLKVAEKKCKELRDKGEHVPADGERDFSAPGAYKPPGVAAAHERKAAKENLAKAEAACGRVNTAVAAREQTFKAVQEKLKGKHEGGESKPAESKKPMPMKAIKYMSMRKSKMGMKRGR